jgi:hypothetical protein
MISWDRVHADVQDNDNASSTLRRAIKSIEDHGCQCSDDDGNDVDECEGACWPALSEAALKELYEKANNLRTEIATLRATMAGMVCGRCFVRGLLETPNTLSPCPVCQPKKEG